MLQPKLLICNELCKMNDTINKRVRSSNWDAQDKNVLRTLVLQRADILENKETSTKINAAKKLVWEDVVSCFNKVSNNKRDLNQILNQWRNMKNRAKSLPNNRRSSSTSAEVFIPEIDLIEEPQASETPSPCLQTKRKKKIYKSSCCDDDHEHELFILAKKSREELILQQKHTQEIRMQQEREIHEKRIDLMRLEEEYWRLKIKRIDET